MAVGAAGHTAFHSDGHTLGVWGQADGTRVAAGGNLLANPDVPSAMVAAFEAATGGLGDRLIAALLAGRDAGGEAGPVRSAGLLMVDRESWPVASLRFDWSEEARPIEAVVRSRLSSDRGCRPIEAVARSRLSPDQGCRARVGGVCAGDGRAYIQRARDARQAPSYGVSGND